MIALESHLNKFTLLNEEEISLVAREVTRELTAAEEITGEKHLVVLEVKQNPALISRDTYQFNKFDILRKVNLRDLINNHVWIMVATTGISIFNYDSLCPYGTFRADLNPEDYYKVTLEFPDL